MEEDEPRWGPTVPSEDMEPTCPQIGLGVLPKSFL